MPDLIRAILSEAFGLVAAIGAANFGLALLGVFTATMVQRLAGQGFGLIAAPVLALAAPGFLPASLLILGIFVGLGASALSRDAITPRELPPGLIGRTLGAVMAAFVALSLPDPRILAFIICGVVFLAIGLSLAGLRVKITGFSLFGAGLAAGVMGTLTAIGAPPMAMLYQYEEPRRAAAMQNVFFAVGMIVSIGALAFAGLVGLRHLILAAALAPAAIVAMLAAQPLSRHIARARMRPIALSLAGLSAAALLLKQVV